jgi:gamma-glutamyltranspeptidase/glutathione hydrolase
MVSSPHHAASQAGLLTLARGGSAADAAIALNAVLGVAYPHMAGPGGDMFCLAWDASRRDLSALNGSGRAARAATIDFYRERGHAAIPGRGALAIVTVPGAVDGWWQLHQRHGRLPWADLFEPAIELATAGFGVSESLATWTARNAEVLAREPATSAAYLPGGRAPELGDRATNAALATTLRAIANGGADAFYRGDLAGRIGSSVSSAGSPLDADDLANHTATWVDPISIEFRGKRVFQLPPNTQGFTALQMLGILDGVDVAALGDGSAAYVHVMAEAARIAFEDRDRYCTDPAFLDIPMHRLLGQAHLGELRARIDMDRRTDGVATAAAGGDTCFFCVVDDDGNAVSMIQSIYHDFGSAFVAGDTGVLLQNRGSFFSLDPTHPNRLQPGKRTFHTIIPAMMFEGDEPLMLYGTMGGEGQPQTQAAIATRVLDFGMDVQRAIERPRWLYGRTWGVASSALRLEEDFGDVVAATLARMGHVIEIVPRWSDVMGHAQAIHIDRDRGVLSGGADPRGDGAALGW